MINSVLIIATISVVTILLRFIPFLVFGENRKTPKIINYLGEVLPFAIIGMLVVYCLKDINPTATPYGIPELCCCIAVALLHIWKRNTLLSVGAGTILYMLITQFIL